MSSRSGDGDPRGNGDSHYLPPPRTAPMIPPPPNIMDPPLVAMALFLRTWCASFQLPSYAQYHQMMAVLATRHTEYLLHQQHLPVTIHGPGADVDLENLGEGSNFQPHTYGVLALLTPMDTTSTPCVTSVGGDVGTSPPLSIGNVQLGFFGERGFILQPHTDGVLALPFAGVPASPESSPRVTSVGGGYLGFSCIRHWDCY